MDVSGSSVIVTGGASGLGAATAKRFADAGATVFGLDLQPSIDKATPVENVHLVATDVTKEDEVLAAIAEAHGGRARVVPGGPGARVEEGKGTGEGQGEEQKIQGEIDKEERWSCHRSSTILDCNG